MNQPNNNGDVFYRAIEVLEERGWHQGTLVADLTRRDTAPLCVLGALNVASSGTLAGGCGIDNALALARAVGTRVSGIAMWNDDPSRTYEDIILGLKRAAHGEVVEP